MSKYQKITEEDSIIIERMYEAGDATSKIATTVNKSLRSVQRYIQLHISEEEGKPWIPFNTGATVRKSKELERQAALEKVLMFDCSLTQEQMINRFPSELKCSRTTLRRTMQNMDVTRKRLRRIPRPRNDAETIRDRKTFAFKVHRKSNSVLFYFDETGFNLHTGPIYGYAIKGVCPSIEQPGNRGQNVSVICLIGETGFVHYEYVDGAYTAERICDFFDNALPKLPRNATLIFDNARIHKSECVKLKLQEHHIDFEFLPTYSPQLNPIENFFSVLKARQRRIRPRPKNRDELKESIDQCFGGLSEFSCENLYHKMREFVEIAMRGEPFLE